MAQPRWQGQLYETTSLSRQLDTPLLQDLSARYANGLLPRLAARLAELAQCVYLPAFRLPAATPAPAARGWGLAQVEAARGRLLHAVELNGETVRSYRILAPTEWNFHPQGVTVQSLSGLNAEDIDILQRQAVLLITAIDPCVDYRLTLC